MISGSRRQHCTGPSSLASCRTTIPSPTRTQCALADELDFIVQVEPTRTANAVAPMFLEVLERQAPELRELYRLPVVAAFSDHAEIAPPDREVDAEPRPPSFPASRRTFQDTGLDSAAVPSRAAGLYWDEVSSELRTALFAAELAVPSRRSRFSQVNPRPWVAMHTALAWVYKCVFVEELARQGRFAPTTDQPAAHLASDGWDMDRIAAALLDPAPVPVTVQNPTGAVGMLAIRIVVPEDLTDVPVRKIVELRRRHRSEFEAFSAAITETVAILRAELADVTLPEARDRYVQMEVERRFALPLKDLRGAMKGLGVETAFSAANLKFELPAASTVAGGALAGEPVIGAALGAAFAVGGLRRAANQQRQALLAASPAAYLLSVERGLEPSSLLRRITGGGLRRT
ncbi:DUF6236 family protein [Streptomyces lutosisoli]